MITCEELDYRLKCLYPNFKETAYGPSRLGFLDFMATYKNHELIEFTNLLHGYLLSQEFSATYEPDDEESRAQDIWVRMGPGPSNIIRVTIRYDGYLQIDRGASIPRVFDDIWNDPTPVKRLVTGLHEVRQLLISSCRTCYYSSFTLIEAFYILDAGYCGKGLQPLHKCSGYRPVKNNNQ